MQFNWMLLLLPALWPSYFVPVSGGDRNALRPHPLPWLQSHSEVKVCKVLGRLGNLELGVHVLPGSCCGFIPRVAQWPLT
jgi:hypothetical protein